LCSASRPIPQILYIFTADCGEANLGLSILLLC
jgi:hypothetical protein